MKSRKGSIEKKLKKDLKKKRVSRHYRKFKKSIVGGQGATGLGFAAEKMAETDSLTPEQWEAAIEAGLKEDRKKAATQAQVPKPISAVPPTTPSTNPYVAQGSIAKTEELQNNENVSPVEYMSTGSVEKDTKLEDNVQAKITPATGLSTEGEQQEINVGQIGEEEEKNMSAKQNVAEPELAQPEYAPQGEKREPVQLTNNNIEISEPKLIGRSTITPIASYTIPETDEVATTKDKPLSPFEIFINMLKTHNINYLNIFGSIFYLEKLYGFTKNANIQPAMYSLQSFKEMFNVKEDDLCKTIKAYVPLFGIQYADFRNQKAPIDDGLKRGASAEDDEILKTTLKHYRELLNNRVQLNIGAARNSRTSLVQLKKVDSYIAFLEGEGGERVKPLAGVSCDVGALKELAPVPVQAQAKPFDCKDMKDCPELKAIRRLLSLLIMKNKESPTVVDNYLEGQDEKILEEILRLIKRNDVDGPVTSANANTSASAIKDDTAALVETLKAELEELKKTQPTVDTSILETLEVQIDALSSRLDQEVFNIMDIEDALGKIQEQLATIPGTDSLQLQINELSKKTQPIVMDKKAILEIVQEYMEEHYPKKEVKALEQASQTVEQVSEAVQSGDTQKLQEKVEALNSTIDELGEILNAGLSLKPDVEEIKKYATANSVEELTAKLEELKNKLAVLEGQEKEKSEDSTIGDILRRLVEAEGKVSALETKPTTPDYSTAIEELKTSLSQSQEQSRQAIANMTDTVASKNAGVPRTEFDQLKADLQALQAEKAAEAETQLAELAQLNQSYSAVIEQLENHRIRIEALEEEKDAIRQDMTGLINIPGEISGLAEKLNGLTAKLGDKEKEMEALKDLMTAKDKELATIRSELDTRVEELKKEVVAKPKEVKIEEKPAEEPKPKEEKGFEMKNPMLATKKTETNKEEKKVKSMYLKDYFNSFYKDVQKTSSIAPFNPDLTELFKKNKLIIQNYIRNIRQYSQVFEKYRDKDKENDTLNTFYTKLIGVEYDNALKRKSPKDPYSSLKPAIQGPSQGENLLSVSHKIVYGLFNIFMKYVDIEVDDVLIIDEQKKADTLFNDLVSSIGQDNIFKIFKLQDSTIGNYLDVKDKLYGNYLNETNILGQSRTDLLDLKDSRNLIEKYKAADSLKGRFLTFGKKRGGAGDDDSYTIGDIALQLIGGMIGGDKTDDELGEILGGYSPEQRAQLTGHLAFLQDVYEVAA